MSPARTRRQRKALGQHFLTDVRVAERQLGYADLQPDDVVLEIGPGPGVLTRRIAPRVGRLIAVEKDEALARRLQMEFAQNDRVSIIAGDATEVALGSLGSFNKIVANLPFSVSTPITFRFLPATWDLAVLMYQEEFARRLVAEVGQKTYGRLSAARAYFAAAEYLETVPRGAFQPPPEVNAGVVRLRRHRNPPFEVANADEYLELLRVLFSTRRKTIRATLHHQWKTLGLGGPEAADAVAQGWGRGSERPERVPPAELGRLSILIHEARGHG